MALKAPEIPKEAVPEEPWNRFLRRFQPGGPNTLEHWGQGQHITALGRTRGGKTNTLIQVIEQRRYVFAILTKREDPLFPLLKRHGFKMRSDLRELESAQTAPRVALHVKPEGLSRGAAAWQAEQVRDALHQVWEQGKWTLYLDEIATLTDQLGLGAELRQLWKEAGSSRISIVAGTQRPSRIPLEAYSQPRFLMLWKSNDREELRRLAGLNGVDPEPVRDVVTQLDRYEILLVDTWADELVRTRPPKLR